MRPTRTLLNKKLKEKEKTQCNYCFRMQSMRGEDIIWVLRALGNVIETKMIVVPEF